MGNQKEIKTRDHNSSVEQCLNNVRTDWRTLIETDDLKYLCTDSINAKTKIFCYKSSWTDCLRLIRNVGHWRDRPHPMPQPKAFCLVGDPQEYFNLFPSLPVEEQKIVRSCHWKEQPDLKEYFA